MIRQKLPPTPAATDCSARNVSPILVTICWPSQTIAPEITDQPSVKPLLIQPPIRATTAITTEMAVGSPRVIGSPGWRGSALILLLCAAPLPTHAGDRLADLDDAALDLPAEVDGAELLSYAPVADQLN